MERVRGRREIEGDSCSRFESVEQWEEVGDTTDGHGRAFWRQRLECVNNFLYGSSGDLRGMALFVRGRPCLSARNFEGD